MSEDRALTLEKNGFKTVHLLEALLHHSPIEENSGSTKFRYPTSNQEISTFLKEKQKEYPHTLDLYISHSNISNAVEFLRSAGTFHRYEYSPGQIIFHYRGSQSLRRQIEKGEVSREWFESPELRDLSLEFGERYIINFDRDKALKKKVA